ncbi:S-layer homology domain-containing protein [Halothermothrix orenii]|uniref:S-layer domain protein n=1 Tax=Halothermothrix orenii (strain H 168 / OCM 544 / DSM 9562) TaxID=373903 RepID=B8CZ58_HALOH|nr:S-layer homology domain-containing protein [Halothermothrix orenii]ACL70577.1 S-layer domain protein [Halothermothrix orenii H 168]
MKRLIALLLVGVLMLSAVPVFGADFKDAPSPDHWVYENFQVLNEAGLIEGYPDQTFRGDQAATRYEMVEMTARILKYLESKVDKEIEDKLYLNEEMVKDLISDALADQSKVDEVYDALTTLEKEFKDELDAMGVKVTTLEDEVASLRSDVNTLKESGDAKKALDEAKKAKIMAIIGIVLGVIGIVR